MFTELGLAVLGTYAYNYLNTADERKFKNNFSEVMIKTGIKNKEDETFKIYKTENTSYGYICYLKNVKGLSIEHLEDKLNIIEGNLNGIVQFQKDRFKDYIQMWIVNQDISTFKFEPVKTKEYELYIGKDFKGQNYLINLNKDSHLLIGGVTGCGKSFLLACILTNLIYNSSKSIEIFLLQICKSEISAFENCSCIEYVAYDVAQCIIGLNKLIKELDRRSELFKKYGIRNITQWNQHRKDKYMKRIIIAIEEISFFMDCGNIEVWESILKLSKAGRSCGLHIISALQRSTSTNLNTDVKSQMTRISFRQKSSIDSTNIINTPEAKNLKERECIIDVNSDYSMIKTAWVDEDYVLLHKYIPEIKIPTQEEKQEIINVKKINNKIYSIEQPKVIDIEESDVIELSKHGVTEDPKKNKPHKGVISLEDFKNANKKG